MTAHIYRWLACAMLLLWGTGAHAAITCTVSSNGFGAAYNPTLATPTIVQTSFTVTCTRGAASDPTTLNYAVGANNGMYANGINNRAFLGPNGYLRYDIYVDGSCSTQLKGNTTIGGAFTFSGTGTMTRTHNVWGCVSAGVTGLAAGVYSDTVALTLSYGPNPQSTSATNFAVNIATPATCSITAMPGNVAFGTYVAYGSALSATAGFGTTCTNYLAYTVSVAPTSGTIAGLDYTLLLQNALPVMSGTSLSVTGSGVQQNYTISGAMAAGQPGTCAAGICSAAVPHTLMLSY